MWKGGHRHGFLTGCVYCSVLPLSPHTPLGGK
jgi:hypothetical protein